MREIRLLRSTGRGWKRGHGDFYTGTKPETVETAKESSKATAPALDPT